MSRPTATALAPTKGASETSRPLDARLQQFVEGNDQQAVNELIHSDALMTNGGRFDDHGDNEHKRTMEAFAALGFATNQARTLAVLNSGSRYSESYRKTGQRANEWANAHIMRADVRQSIAFRELGKRLYQWKAAYVNASAEFKDFLPVQVARLPPMEIPLTPTPPTVMPSHIRHTGSAGASSSVTTVTAPPFIEQSVIDSAYAAAQQATGSGGGPAN